MKLTVLDYVQNIASAMSSDEVNSIADTVESMQIAEIVKTTYFNIIARAGLPEGKKFFQLDASLSGLTPVMMFIPEGIRSMEWMKYYNRDPDTDMYEYVTLLPLKQFLDFVNGYDRSQSYVDFMDLTIGPETFEINFRNDVQPQCACVISDYYVIFDSYNSALETTLESSNTQCWGQASPTWEMTDTFIPQLDEEQVPLLLNEAKSLAFFELKQQEHSKAEKESRRQWATLQRTKSVDNKPSYFDQLPDFGRKRAYSKGPYFRWH